MGYKLGRNITGTCRDLEQCWSETGKVITWIPECSGKDLLWEFGIELNGTERLERLLSPMELGRIWD